MPPIQKQAVMPNKPSSKVWKYYGDNHDGQFAHCLLCKYNPNKGVDLHIKVNGGKLLCISFAPKNAFTFFVIKTHWASHKCSIHVRIVLAGRPCCNFSEM